MIEVLSIIDFQIAIKSNVMVLAYLSHQTCSVCKILKPKIEELIKEEFPDTKLIYADLENIQEIKGQYSVYTVPTILLFIDGKENLRRSRNIGINELREYISRPYNIIFG